MTAHPGHADAIVVLGPSNKRVTQALSLARQLDVKRVVLSIGDFAGQGSTCRQPGFQVTCFTPDPFNTAGEAAQIGALASENGWRSIIVITPVPQAARAHWLAARCFGGQVQLVAATNRESHVDAFGWMYQAIYQSAAWAKDLVTASCEVPRHNPPPPPAGVAPA